MTFTLTRTLCTAATLALLVGWLPAPPAAAGTVTVQYQIDSGTTFNMNPAGSTTNPYTGGGTFAVRYQAASAYSLQAGPATLVTLNVTNRNQFLVGSPGTFPTSLFTPLSGGYAIGARVATFTGTFGLTAVAQWFTSGGDGVLTLATGGAIPPYGSGVSGTQYVGMEVDRTFMPEPPGEWVLPGSAMLLGMLGWWRRQEPARSASSSA